MNTISKSQALQTHPGLQNLLQDQKSFDKEVQWLERLVHPKRVLRVSGLLGCIRAQWFRENRKDAGPSQQTGTDAEEYWSRIRGQMFHAGLEAYGPKEGAEQRLWAAVETIYEKFVIAGKPDIVQVENGHAIITDLKTSRRLPSGKPHESHWNQLKMYGWLLRENGCDLPMVGQVYYMSDSDGFRGFADELHPYSVADILWMIYMFTREEMPDANPRGAWECRACPYVECDQKKLAMGVDLAPPKRNPVEEFGLNEVIDEVEEAPEPEEIEVVMEESPSEEEPEKDAEVETPKEDSDSKFIPLKVELKTGYHLHKSPFRVSDVWHIHTGLQAKATVIGEMVDRRGERWLLLSEMTSVLVTDYGDGVEELSTQIYDFIYGKECEYKPDLELDKIVDEVKERKWWDSGIKGDVWVNVKAAKNYPQQSP